MSSIQVILKLLSLTSSSSKLGLQMIKKFPVISPTAGSLAKYLSSVLFTWLLLCLCSSRPIVENLSHLINHFKTSLLHFTGCTATSHTTFYSKLLIVHAVGWQREPRLTDSTDNLRNGRKFIKTLHNEMKTSLFFSNKL